MDICIMYVTFAGTLYIDQSSLLREREREIQREIQRKDVHCVYIIHIYICIYVACARYYFFFLFFPQDQSQLDPIKLVVSLILIGYHRVNPH